MALHTMGRNSKSVERIEYVGIQRTCGLYTHANSRGNAESVRGGTVFLSLVDWSGETGVRTFVVYNLATLESGRLHDSAKASAGVDEDSPTRTR